MYRKYRNKIKHELDATSGDIGGVLGLLLGASILSVYDEAKAFVGKMVNKIKDEKERESSQENSEEMEEKKELP